MGEERERDKKREKSEKTAVEPVPKDPAFFEWLEKLFYDEPEIAHYPERVDCRVLEGKRGEKFGQLLKQVVFAPAKAGDEAIKAGAGRRKPTREELVNLSNELLFRMQKDCDELGKKQLYGVHAWHFSRGDDPYERWLKRMEPSGRYAKDGEEDEEEKSLQDQHSLKVLDHGERMFALYTAALEGIVDRYDRASVGERERIDSLEKKNVELLEISEKALSLEVERRTKLEWEKIKIEGVRKGLDLAVNLGPALVNQLVGKKVVDTPETPETLTIKNFFKMDRDGGLLTQVQSNAAFGTYDDKPPHALLKPGVLTTMQAKILFDVAHCNIAPDELNQLLPGGANAIVMEQLMQLQQIFSMEQLMPIQVLFNKRMQERPVQGVVQE